MAGLYSNRTWNHAVKPDYAAVQLNEYRESQRVISIIDPAKLGNDSIQMTSEDSKSER